MIGQKVALGVGPFTLGNLDFEFLIDVHQLLDGKVGGLLRLFARDLSLDAGHRNRKIDRLGDVVIGAQFQRLDDIGVARLGRDHQNRQTVG